jgi:hypothetical protein
LGVRRTRVDLIDTADFYGLGHNESPIAAPSPGIDRDQYSARPGPPKRAAERSK